jgi:NADPH:quinone reductase-like Zn-dependent oxidoreductase
MKAIARDAYGSPELLELREVEKPAVGADGVLVRVHASSVNAQDWHLLRGLPYFVRLIEGLSTPKSKVLGGDVAGIVEAVGEEVTEFQPGDEVFGSRYGAFADYVRGRERNFAPKPAGLTFEEAAAIPLAGITALQALRDRGGIRAGQRVLINGAAGGVGTFSVQIAKVFGAAVTAVCSTRNVDLVRSLGADEVIDYTAEDFTRNGREHELIFDIAGNRPLRDVRRALTPEGTLVLVGGGGLDDSMALFGPLVRSVKAFVFSPFVGQRLLPFLAKIRKEDLLVLKELVEAGKIRPVIDRTYPLRDTPEAIRYLETGHARGKTVISM